MCPKTIPKICRWRIGVAKQRLRYKLRKQGKEVKLTNENILELEGIGFVWDVEKSIIKPKQKNTKSRDLQWKKRVAELREYQKEKGHCHVPKICQSVIISSRDLNWMTRVEELIEFRNEKGHCQVPYRYEANQHLGYWVQNMRGHYTKHKQGEKLLLLMTE